MIIYSEYVLNKYIFCSRNVIQKTCNNSVSYNIKNDFLECSLLGISHPDKLNFIVDAHIPKQECTSCTTEMDDDWMADYFDSYAFSSKEEPVELEHVQYNVESPAQITKVWMHTHPHESPNPSGTDNETFSKWFKDLDFCAMNILAKDLSHYSRMRYQTQFGPRSCEEETYVYVGSLKKTMTIEDFVELKVAINKIQSLCRQNDFPEYEFTPFEDFSKFHDLWKDEIQKNVFRKTYVYKGNGGVKKQKTKIKVKEFHRNYISGPEMAGFCFENDVNDVSRLSNIRQKAEKTLQADYPIILEKFKELMTNGQDIDSSYMAYVENMLTASNGNISSKDVKEVCEWLEITPKKAREVIQGIMS